MAVSIIPRIERGRLYFQFDSVPSSTIAQAAAWTAAQARRLDVFEPIEQPSARLALTLVDGGVAWTL